MADESAVGSGAPGGPPALALVHHGHQHLIADGYDNHEGLSELVEAYTAVLALHLKYRVPINLHLSGTLIEAVAWHSPDFFGWVRALAADGLVEILGSAYSQPILRLFSVEHNHRQLIEDLRLVARHLDVDPHAVRGFWLPERVWDTGELAALIRDPELGNGGYRYVLLDDRLAYAASTGERTVFDASSAPGRSVGPVSGSRSQLAPAAVWALPATSDERQFRPALIAGGGGLVAVPISGNLRYAVPPRSTRAWHGLEATLAATAAAGPGAVAVYADDLEKAASVGPWTSGAWLRENVMAYEQLLVWLRETGAARPVLLGEFLAEHPPGGERDFEPGTFCELAGGGAGEDYSKWWNAPAYAPFRRHLEHVESLLVARPSTPGGGGLVDLAWKQLMVASYETAWHGLGAPDDEVAPWARAAASHGRSALVTLAAERYQPRHPHRRRGAGGSAAQIWVSDIDDDGADEIVLANEALFAVVSPQFGGRVVAAFDLTVPGGRQVVGNPADDWNWQEELNRWMETPANHPGAFTDCGSENVSWDVADVVSGARGVEVLLRADDGGTLAGSTKRFRLGRGGRLGVEYQLAVDTERFDVEVGLSPDYLRLLREGRGAARAFTTGSCRGFACGAARVWVELPAGEPVLWAPVPARPAGHVLGLRISAYRPRFRLALGVGNPGESDRRLLESGARRPSAACQPA